MKRLTFYISLLLGITFDVLFWDKPQGISFLIFITLLLLFGYFLLRKMSVKGNKSGYLFLIPIVILSIFSFVRAEPFTAFLNRWLTITLIGILSVGYRSGLWFQFGLIDHISKAVDLFGHMVSVPWLRTKQIAIFSEDNNQQVKKKKFKPILRGILITTPIVIIFSVLFASADLVFDASLQKLLSHLNIPNLGEIFARIFVIFIITNAFLGLITFVVLHSKEKKLIGKEKPFISPFLGTIETTIILSSVLLLFITFLIVQFKYFFFNHQAILEMGFTYSEYARKGFGELIAISIFSLGLILILNTVTQKKNRNEKLIFSILNIGLVICNLIVLVSSFMRLYLYESAYGFTRLRTYSHAFIIWMGILLLTIAYLLWKRRSRLFTNISIICALGFALSLNILNVDGFIVHQNISRVHADSPLDSNYLASLSTDAVPALVKAYLAEDTSQSTRLDLGASVACYKTINENNLNDDQWQIFTTSKQQANRYLLSIATELEEYKIIEGEWELIIQDVAGNETICYRSDLPF